MLGRRVSEFIERLERRAVDPEVEVSVERRVHGGTRHTDRERFRLVGVRDPVTGTYHLCLTSIPPEQLSPEDIAQIHAARRVIEPLFRELKRRTPTSCLPPGATSSRRLSTPPRSPSPSAVTCSLPSAASRALSPRASRRNAGRVSSPRSPARCSASS